MKEFALKHPILTFLLVDTLIAAVTNTIRAFARDDKTEATEDTETETKEE